MTDGSSELVGEFKDLIKEMDVESVEQFENEIQDVLDEMDEKIERLILERQEEIIDQKLAEILHSKTRQLDYGNAGG